MLLVKQHNDFKIWHKFVGSKQKQQQQQKQRKYRKNNPEMETQ